MPQKYTHRTTDGRLARILCTDRTHPTHTVVALAAFSEDGSESPIYLTKDLCKTISDAGYSPTPFLHEISIWEYVAIDTSVWVRRQVGEGIEYVPYHFAGYSKGYVKVWRDGCTSHTVSFKDDEALSTYRLLCSDVFLEAPSDA
jgi:hypothetical protein